jgi:hypothetical protein
MHCRALIKALPLGGEGSVRKKALFPDGRKKAYKRRLFPLAGKEGLDKKGRSHTRESKMTSAWHAYPAERSRVPPREHA